MAKNMARIDNGVVTNVEWHADSVADSETLIGTRDRSVGIGDNYADGRFYRNGTEILSLSEKLADAENALAILYGGAV